MELGLWSACSSPHFVLRSLKQLGRDVQALLGPSWPKGLLHGQLVQQQWSLLCPLLPPLMANHSLSCRRDFQESQVSQASLKHRIKQSPLDVSIEVVLKEKYKEADSALPGTSGTTLLNSKAKTNINPGNLISWLKKQESTKGLISDCDPGMMGAERNGESGSVLFEILFHVQESHINFRH